MAGGARSRWVTLACAGIVAAIAVERLRAFAAAPPTDFDDAYMFLRYANNLLAGHGLAWNPGGEAVYGVTGRLHLVVVTILRGLAPRFGDAGILRAASVGAGVAGLAALALVCARFSPHPRLRGRPLLWAALLLPLVAYSEAFTFHALDGMDTLSSFFAAILMMGATLGLCARPTRNAALGCAAAGFFAWLARPDDGLYALACPLLALALVCPPPRAALAAWFVVPFALLLGADLFFAHHFFGSALPLALWAKRPHAYGGFVGEYTWNPFLFLEVFFRAAAPFVVVLLLCAGRRHARRLAVIFVPVTLTFGFFFAMNQIMGHLGRFYFPSLPLFAIAAAQVVDAELRPRRLLIGAAAALLLLGAGGPLLEWAGARYEARAATQPLAPLDGYEVAARTPLPELDSWDSSTELALIAAASPPGARFAMTEHGLVGARAPRAVIVDLTGLHDRAFARGFTTAELWRRDPDAIWLPHWDYTQMIRDLLDDEVFWSRYLFYPDVFTYGLAVRRDATEVRARFAERFAARYPGLALDDYLAHR